MKGYYRMKAVVIETCDCEKENCSHLETVLICLYANEETETHLIERLKTEFDIEPCFLPPDFINKFWSKIEEQKEIFEQGLVLARQIKR